MRPTFPVLLALLAALAVAPYPEQAAHASCVGPMLELTGHPVLAQDQELTIDGKWFVDGCQDSMSCSAGPGCDDCHYDSPPPEPMTSVDLVLHQNGVSWVLGTADANEDGAIAWRFRLPDEVDRGTARLGTENGSPTEVRIR